MEAHLLACIRYDNSIVAALVARLLLKDSHPGDDEGFDEVGAVIFDALEFTEYAEGVAFTGGCEVCARWVLGGNFIEDTKFIIQDLLSSGGRDVIYLLHADDMERVVLRTRNGDPIICGDEEFGFFDTSETDDDVYAVLSAIRDGNVRPRSSR